MQIFSNLYNLPGLLRKNQEPGIAWIGHRFSKLAYDFIAQGIFDLPVIIGSAIQLSGLPSTLNNSFLSNDLLLQTPNCHNSYSH
jgi:hypothetical protein